MYFAIANQVFFLDSAVRAAICTARLLILLVNEKPENL
jgi:hypothetical protein